MSSFYFIFLNKLHLTILENPIYELPCFHIVMLITKTRFFTKAVFAESYNFSIFIFTFGEHAHSNSSLYTPYPILTQKLFLSKYQDANPH